ncbi:SlyX family protein [Herminiimonas sp. CN]|uniref:SlyX family protein n=1 Tax=Herminiimonas sp. CN TaxID=1349818 RepID=UPI00047362E6|nr:SlyX family protein [Herminiimonas sp. CN]
MSPEARMIEIEIKVARQEDLLEELNTLVYRQQQKIDRLETLCAALARLVKEPAGDQDGNGANERPPHY